MTALAIFLAVYIVIRNPGLLLLIAAVAVAVSGG
jgi:hypothetical protein